MSDEQLTPEELANFAPSSNRRGRGRPRKEDGEIYKWDIRMVPVDQQKIDFNKNISALNPIKLLVGEEYAKDNGKLHYHLYLETRLSETAVVTGIKKLARWTPLHPAGNALYGKRIAHDGTEGYAVKDGAIVCSYGYNGSELDAIVLRSKQYRRDLATASKAKLRATQKTMKSIVQQAIDEDIPVCTHSIVSFILKKHDELDLEFPSRPRVENAVMKFMYRKGAYNYVQEYYTKNI